MTPRFSTIASLGIPSLQSINLALLSWHLI
jgi:hypothetical protein